MTGTENKKIVSKASHAIVKAPRAPAVAPLAMMDTDRFDFRPVEISLDNTAAYSLDGETAMAFGLEAIEIGRKSGIDIVDPDEVIVNGESHHNPYTDLDPEGNPRVIYIRKIGTHIDLNGMIRYVDLTDRMDIAAYIGERASKVAGYNLNSKAIMPMTRATSEKLNVKGELNNVWWFLPVENWNVGIGFNKGASDKAVNSFSEEILHFRKGIERRFQTSVGRRVVASLIPGTMKTKSILKKKVTKKRKDKHGNWVNYEAEVIDKATFTAICPHKKGFEFSLLQMIARAIKENNKALEEQALARFGEITGITPQLTEAGYDTTPDPTLETEKPEEEAKEAKEVEGELIDEPTGFYAPPSSNKAQDFRDYLVDVLPKLEPFQKADVDEILSGADASTIKGDVLKAVRSYLIALSKVGKHDREETGEVNPKEYVLEMLSEGSQRTLDIMEEQFGKNFSADELTDMDFEVVYKKLTET